ncbi:MAG: triose-phosphate isomerase [Alphaproteobacteria bacterium]
MHSLVAGNWKMNGLAASLAELETLKAALAAAAPACEVLVCPPFTLLAQAAVVGGVALGGQDCSPRDGGAFTGAFRGDMVGATLTYRATGNITFSGAVTGDVAVVLGGDCPGGPDVPDQPGLTPTPAPTPTPTPAPTPAPAPPLPALALIGNWSGAYSLNAAPGSMTWSITTGGADGNSGTYAGSVDPMRSGSLNLGVLSPDNSLSMTLRLTCPNQLSLVVFQGNAQLSGSTIRGTASSVGGGNCGDPNLVTWTVSVAMTKN